MAQFNIKDGAGFSSDGTITPQSQGAAVLATVSAFSMRFLSGVGLDLDTSAMMRVLKSSILTESATITIAGTNPAAINTAVFSDVVSSGQTYRGVSILTAVAAIIGQSATLAWIWNGMEFTILVTIV